MKKLIIMFVCIILAGCATAPDPYREISVMLRDMERRNIGLPADFPMLPVAPVVVPVMPIGGYGGYGYYGGY